MATLEENVRQVNSDFKAIRNKIVECGVEVADGTRTSEYANKVGKVYEAGKKSEYDAFWDAFQVNGTRTNYRQAFINEGWTAENFKPKHPFDNVLDAYAMFKASKITYLPSINVSNSTVQLYAMCDECKFLEEIEECTLSENNTFNYTFSNCPKLKKLIIKGTIGQNGFSTNGSPLLSKESIVSIINALSSTTSGLLVKLSKTSVNAAFETASGKKDGSESAEWKALIAPKQENWEIQLA